MARIPVSPDHVSPAKAAANERLEGPSLPKYLGDTEKADKAEGKVAEEIDVAAAYRRGTTTFMGLELLVAPGALVPRPETELLCATAIDMLREMSLPAPRVIDMCCGAGNLCCAIAHHVPNAQVWASDLADSCVELTRRNAARHGLAGRISVHQGDAFQAFLGIALEGSIDMIVCNPPYISEQRLSADRAHLLDLEPREAFAAGPFGASIHMRVAKDAPRYLRAGGVLLFEVGLGQDRQVKLLMERSKDLENIRAITNDNGEYRVVLGSTRAQA